MSLTHEQLRAAVMAQQSPEEMRSCVVYIASTPISRGTKVSFPRLTFEAPWDAFMAFVDLDPTANWSHPARYLFVDRTTGEVTTLDAQLPPFRNAEDSDPYAWRVLYQAPSVPDAVLAAPSA